MNLTISNINPSFGNISKFKELAQNASDCIARAKCYAEIRTSKNFKPDKHSSKILLEKMLYPRAQLIEIISHHKGEQPIV